MKLVHPSPYANMYSPAVLFCSTTVPNMATMASVSFRELKNNQILDAATLYQALPDIPLPPLLSGFYFASLAPFLYCARKSAAALPIWLSGFRALAFSHEAFAPTRK